MKTINQSKWPKLFAAIVIVTMVFLIGAVATHAADPTANSVIPPDRWRYHRAAP